MKSNQFSGINVKHIFLQQYPADVLTFIHYLLYNLVVFSVRNKVHHFCTGFRLCLRIPVKHVACNPVLLLYPNELLLLMPTNLFHCYLFT